MTRAYQEIYLNKAQSVLGDAFDYAINTCGIAGNDFITRILRGNQFETYSHRIRMHTSGACKKSRRQSSLCSNV